MKKILLAGFLAVVPCVASNAAWGYEPTPHEWNTYIGANMGISASDVTAHSEDFLILVVCLILNWVCVKIVIVSH
ncbi:MAG: hypothetical protein IKS08_01585 [Alphaproteobacteria bacterium]|nr:hypothetical protein [Alphaproteobacteria bacterium]